MHKTNYHPLNKALLVLLAGPCVQMHTTSTQTREWCCHGLPLYGDGMVLVCIGNKQLLRFNVVLIKIEGQGIMCCIKSVVGQLKCINALCTHLES